MATLTAGTSIKDDWLLGIGENAGIKSARPGIVYDDDAEGYKAMAADTEREREAREWCNACFGRVIATPEK